MTVIGVSFDLQQDGDFRLVHVLEDIIDPSWCWRFNGGENYIRNSADDPWDMTPFYTDWSDYCSEQFLNAIQTPNQYIIFSDFKAFPSKEQIQKVLTYEEFLDSDCQLAAIIIDAAYIILVSKDVPALIEKTRHRPNFNLIQREDLSHLTI